ncbi:MAG: hypothetical protein HZT43_19940 [Exiguobacterium profundum]|nr:MAG: hypothetical protein HZT43_19940 [Exiguobacterium profundum]
MLAALLLSQAAAAETEVHAIGIYEAEVHRGSRIGGPEVPVTVDRPGAGVVLVLTSFEPARWLVTTTPGTTLDRVVLGGPSAGRAEVIVNGLPKRDVERVGLPYTYQAQGKEFRAFVATVPQLLQVSGLNSFQGEYTAPVDGFVIASAQDDNPALRHDYLADQVVDPATQPEAFRRFLAPDAVEAPPQTLVFTEDGFRLTEPDGQTKTIPITLDVPQVSWPMGAARDTVTGKMYGVTLGGEGYLYVYDPASSKWSVASSMRNADASGMIYDPEGRRLVIVVSGLVSPQGYSAVLWPRRPEGQDAAVVGGLPRSGRHGRSRQWPRPVAGPAGGCRWPRPAAGNRAAWLPKGTAGPMRLYSVDMQTGQAALLSFADPGSKAVEPW